MRNGFLFYLKIHVGAMFILLCHCPSDNAKRHYSGPADILHAPTKREGSSEKRNDSDM